MDRQFNKKGFTILEIAVSLTIISVGMLGLLALVVQSLQAKDIDKNRIVASQLAQEGLEVVRSTRDYNWLPEPDSETGWRDGLINGGSYTVDYKGVIDDSVNSVSDPGAELYINEDGFYDHDDDGESTIFSRIIRADSPNTASTSISCIVEWEDRGNEFRYVAETVLYNWR